MRLGEDQSIAAESESRKSLTIPCMLVGRYCLDATRAVWFADASIPSDCAA